MRPLRKELALASILLVVSSMLGACSSINPFSKETATGQNMDAMDDMQGMAMSDEVPADLDTSTTRMTDDGLFQVSISSNIDPVEINQIHSWTLHVETPEGQAVESAEIAVDGGMPQHNHGFPTNPQVTQDLGGGDYMVEGVKFSMTGWWEMGFTISANGQSDSVTFNIVLP
jgi:hypothetical protein